MVNQQIEVDAADYYDVSRTVHLRSTIFPLELSRKVSAIVTKLIVVIVGER
jgi:hypothetical protein